MPKYNKGEWSEFYTFIKILADKKVYAADEDLKRIENIYYPILKVLRKENGLSKVYDLSQEEVVQVYLKNGAHLVDVSRDVIKSSVHDLFTNIKSAKGASFEVANTDELMTLLHCEKIKSESSKKEDIKLVIHDSITLRDSEVGFSIKSNIGNAPTLLNASSATNFCYEIIGLNDDAQAINEIDTKTKVRDRLNRVLDNSDALRFSHMTNNTFRKNLRKSDSLMPLIISEFLLAYYRGAGNTFKDLTKIVSASETIRNLGLDFDYEDIKFKMKYLLLNIALGMVPATQWDGFLKADGGYLVVKEDGDVLCYHIYNIAQFSEYLFNNTRFDSPSSSRHGYGTVYEENGKDYLNLNIQIRFI